ncbi:piggyBac transposable element-derived protein 4-like protein [Lates japonicus]|uniref:PiggyBac transposable element-derived protein 4-like protein n=1 Tax=Lates japonicus TaxID=270547 RepID=A0AAD3NLW2_LATJO|nr:piggyBac transposable element-derived protein 4-like protein [Lates japonicus]
MKRSLNVYQVLKLFYGEEDTEEPKSTSLSEEESGADDDEVTEPTFVTSKERSRMRSRSPYRRLEPWRTGNDPDAALQISQFMPRRAPEAQVDTHAAYSPLDLFQLYFSPTTVQTLCRNTNSMMFGACGTYRDNRKGCPTGRENALTGKSVRAFSVRWIREGSLVFVKWMDTWEVSVCSTIHPAVSGEVVKRRVKEKDGHWAVKNISCPALIIACIGGVDLSD